MTYVSFTFYFVEIFEVCTFTSAESAELCKSGHILKCRYLHSHSFFHQLFNMNIMEQQSYRNITMIFLPNNAQ